MKDIEAANNLLAVLHRDGGEHTAAVGFIQSCKDGEQVLHSLLLEIDQLRTSLGICKHGNSLPDPDCGCGV